MSLQPDSSASETHSKPDEARPVVYWETWETAKIQATKCRMTAKDWIHRAVLQAAEREESERNQAGKKSLITMS